ncbi:putative ATPase [Conyzicola nivalis]|uniref:ATPase n=1 Tax=Conyzicola nivalis TaxID=1477021 RepID=A0ABV2QM97_9MICO
MSSTLRELAAERKSARVAIERLRLAPVMFELGARPHPPRELYRAYLRQSDVFVGLYGERYGWVAPGEPVSGLEDEYNLAPDLPKLIYIKESAENREERLVELLDRVRDDDGASFKYFSTPQELRRLLEADLATLLAERFDQSRQEPTGETAPTLLEPEAAIAPVPLTELIGRDAELDTVEALLRRDAVRLVTLIGPGGIGKSRLAIDVASRARARGGETAFVDLTAVSDPALVPNAMAEALGVLDTGDRPITEKLTTALRQRRMLVVLDNFEQVLAAAPGLIPLLSAAPGLKLLVTSRALLRVSGEHAVDVGPLALPHAGHTRDTSAAEAAAVALFIERARAVKPDFEVTPENVDAIAAICAALEGVPLAIELAAARSRMLTPASMLARLDRRLSLLSGGPRDLPERQQTLRRTIEWSTQLLNDRDKRLLAELGVFAGSFSLEAVEFVTEDSSGPDFDPLVGLGTLVDNSLVREQDRGGRPYYSMLTTVREYTLEQLEADGSLEATRTAHARYFVMLARSLETDLKDGGQREAIALLNGDRDDLRAVARFLLDTRDATNLAQFSWSLLIYWWLGGLLGEVRAWMDELLGSGVELDDRTRARALYFIHSIALWQEPNDRVMPGLTESVELFARAEDRSGEGLAELSLALAAVANRPPDAKRAEESLDRSIALLRDAHDSWGEAMALVTSGRVALVQKSVHLAMERFEKSLSLARAQGEDMGIATALQHTGWAQLVLGHPDDARASFEESLAISARLGHAEGVAYGLEGLTAIAAAEGLVDRAGRLLRASESLRRQTGLGDARSFSFHKHYLTPILAAHAVELERARREGRDMSIDEAVRFALDRTAATAPVVHAASS